MGRKPETLRKKKKPLHKKEIEGVGVKVLEESRGAEKGVVNQERVRTD